MNQISADFQIEYAPWAKGVVEELSLQMDIKMIFKLNLILVSEDKVLQREAARLIHKTISEMHSSDLYVLDYYCRHFRNQKWCYGCFFDNYWQEIEPERILPFGLSEEERVSVLGFGTCHPSGYYREKSLQVLTGIRSGQEIPFLLLRLKDRIPNINSIAAKAISDRLNQKNSKSFILSLPLIDKLKNSQIKHADIFPQIMELIAKNKDELTINGIKNRNPITRRISFAIASRYMVYDNSTLLKYIAEESSPANRYFALRSIIERLSADEISSIADIYLCDSYPRVRILFLDVYCKYFINTAKDVLINQALSKSSAIRITARFYLKKAFNADFRSIYRNALESHTYAAIMGIGETGNQEDTKLIEKFLQHPRARIAISSIRSISILLGVNALPIVSPFLSDLRIKVSNEALHILIKYASENDVGAVYKEFLSPKPIHVRNNAFKILCALTTWDSLPYIIEACSDSNSKIRLMGNTAWKKWKQRRTNVFILPSKSQMKRIDQAICKYQNEFGEEMAKKMSFAIGIK